ncbi:MAG: Carboxypeptidase regulatory-like protein [Candidatus Sulfotelmatobacter sp.]|nr:Carboxypeptidase regulatory-like protein [Candidatus Sulfotelmatobacter sp.]
MKWRGSIFLFSVLLCLCGSTISQAQEQPAALPDAPKPQPGIIVGTVVDVNDDAVPGAAVVLEGSGLKSPRTVVSNSNGFFEFSDLDPETYHVNINAQGFASWTSPDVTLQPGQYIILTVSKLRIAQAVTTVTVGYSAEEIATEQVKIEEHQRIFGLVPNFYVSYEANAAPLTTKLKFQLASKVAFDPVTFMGVAIVAAAGQAGDHPNYPQGWKGYGERYGAAYANGFTDIMIGGAILPSLLHQDPRYFYQGKGTNKSRALHALASPFVCRGDNGRPQPNYSTIGGDLASAAISNAYYPESNRGVGLFLGNFLIGTGQRAASNLMQEFVLRRLTPKAAKYEK